MKIVAGLAFLGGFGIAALAGCTPEINAAVAYRIAHPPIVVGMPTYQPPIPPVCLPTYAWTAGDLWMSTGTTCR